MKRVFSSIGIGVIMASCQPTNPQPTTNTATNGTMTCTIDGVAWSAVTFNNQLKLNLSSGSAVGNGKKLELMGQNSSSQQLTLTTATLSDPDEDYMPLGTYLSDGQTLGASVQYFGSGINSAETSGSNPGAAEIIITTFDQVNHTCSGTFSFVHTDVPTGDTLSIGTNGQFSSLSFTVD